MSNLHTCASRTSPDPTVFRRAVETLDRYADDLAAVGCSADRVARVRQIADGLHAQYQQLRRVSDDPLADPDIALAYEGAAWLRGRAASARASGVERVSVSAAYAASLGSLLERCARLADQARTATLGATTLAAHRRRGTHV